MSTEARALVVVPDQQINDYPFLTETIEQLANRKFQVAIRTNECQGLSYIMRDNPDLIMVTESIACEKCQQVQEKPAKGHNQVTQNAAIKLISRARQSSNAQIMLLMQKENAEKRFQAFSAGANDVITNLFCKDEMFVRISRLFENSDSSWRPGQQALKANHLSLNPENNQVTWKSEPISLTSSESEILKLLLKFRGEYLSKPYLQMHVLKRPYSRYDRSIDMHVSNLRRKLGKSGHPDDQIFAVRGFGYCYR
ncbi:winged helix-turn-helix transcriptional regulator [Aliikangiella coralliicola]|uniref:Response regulator transcription factor n=1 Tax=Aliikangiella coralliicola TaxID=2592383 RepID=A0A545U617_9GAMM|nr:response regulator transcription factor [Aliikangiella coralliicola]TQV84925.1 response regulator transcription factor [Aliikangiella coralliicola]